MNGLDIIISNSSELPIYQQLYDQLSTLILTGKLQSDYCLPPIRTVAKELRISVITVKRAWEELERAGLICTVTGKGCFVAALHSEELDVRRSSIAFEKLAKEIEYCKSLGLTKDELLEMVRKCYES